MSTKVDVGAPSEDIIGWTTTVVRFHGFADLPTTRGEDNYIAAPEFSISS